MNTASATPVTTTTTLKLGLTTSAGTPITISEPYGTSVTLTAIVTGTGGAVGTVDFTDSNGANPSSIGCDSVNVAYGIASCTTSTLPVGANILNAAFTPTDNTAFAASDTTAAIPPMTYTVLTTSTTTAVGIGLATAPTQLLTNGSEPYGTNMTLTAKITCNSATCTTAAGTMTFTYGASPSTAICTNVQVVSGSAQCTTATLPVSTNETLNAIFTPGSAAFVSSNTLASPLAFAVTAAPTTTALGFFPVSPQTFGTSVTLTATVSCGTPSATCTTAAGTVSFSYGTSPAIPIAACSGVNAVQLSSGIAPCTTATLPLGVNTVNAAFTSTSSSFGSSTASPQSFHVTANAPAVTIGTSSAAPVFGTAVTLTAGGLPAGAGAPVLTVGGTADAVTFLYGTKSPYITPVVCTNVVTIGAGGASCTTYMLPVQANSVVAVFTPGTATASDYTFPVTIPATTSFTSATPVTVTPTAATQSVTLTALPSNYTYVGAVVTLTATLGVPAAADQGTVAFTFGAPVVTGTTTKIYTNPTTATTSLSCATQPITTNANGVTTATCTAPAALTAVTTSTSYNLLQAVYTPKTTGNFVAKAGLTGTADLAVLGAAVTTTTAVTAMPGPNYYGATTLTATVSCATACPTVAGSVSFYNNNVLIAGTETALASGVTTMTPTVPLPVGTNSITATYNSADTATSWGNSSTTSITPVIVIATPTKAVLYAFSSATAASVYGGSTAAVSATQLTATMASTSLANHAFSLYATIASSAGTAVINSGHVSFYDVSTAGSTLLGTASVNVVNGVGTALFTINCQAQTTTCYGSLGVGNHYFAANYGGVYNGTGTAQFAGTMSDTAPVLVSGAPTLTITASSPSVVYGSAVPVIAPLYTISGGGPIAGDIGNCTASGLTDANGMPIYSCTSVASLKPPVCSAPTYTKTTAVGTSVSTSCAAVKDAYYTVVPANGTVTITGATPTLTITSFSETTYGTLITFASTTTSTGTVFYTVDPGSSACTSSCSTSHVSTLSATTLPGNFYVTATVPANGNYLTASATQALKVNSAPVEVSWPDPTPILYGEALSNSKLGACTALSGATVVNGTCSWTSGGTIPSVGSTEFALFTPSPTLKGAYANSTEKIPTNVTPAAPTIYTVPSATSVSNGSTVYASGANVSILSGGIAHNAGGLPVSGTWSWTCATNSITCPLITVAATPVSVTFTPTGGGATNYTTVSSYSTGTSASVGVLSTATVTAWPTASALVYGQPLSSSTLTASSTNGGYSPANGASVQGSYSWSKSQVGGQTPAGTYPGVGTDHMCVTFTPTSPSYGQVYSDGSACTTPATVSLVVSKGTPNVNWAAVQATPIYSPTDNLNDSTIASVASGGTPYTAAVTGLDGIAVAGTFAWDSSDNATTTYPTIGTATHLADFTSTDTSGNYSSTPVTGPVSLTVNPCGYQDSTNSVYAVAFNVNTDNVTQIPTAPFTQDLEGVLNQSVICAVTPVSGDTTISMPIVPTPQITLGTATSTNHPDSLSYGTNSAVLAYGPSATAGTGAVITITDGGTSHASDGTAGSIATGSNYSSGVFASMGGKVDITNTSVATTGIHSPALDATYNGTLAIYNVTATTDGTSDSDSGVIVAGIGGGQVTVNGGSYSNNSAAGSDNAGIRVAGTCTNADTTACSKAVLAAATNTPWSAVTVNDGTTYGGTGTTITAVNGPAVVVEGGNSVVITSSGNTTLSGALGNNQGIFIYQSGILTDATPATTLNPAVFTMNGGNLSYICDSNSGASPGYVASCAGTGQLVANDQNLKSTLFSVTNTTATIGLTDVTVTNTTNTAGDGILLTAAQLSTGPANVTFSLAGETVTGDVIVDSESTVVMYLAADTQSTPVPTTWTGTFGNAIYPNGSGAQGTVNLHIDATSTWIVTAHAAVLNSLTDTNSGSTFPDILCAMTNSGCTVTITNTTGVQPSVIRPNTSTY